VLPAGYFDCLFISSHIISKGISFNTETDIILLVLYSLKENEELKDKRLGYIIVNLVG
jgi:hypothetical protein